MVFNRGGKGEHTVGRRGEGGMMERHETNTCFVTTEKKKEGSPRPPDAPSPQPLEFTELTRAKRIHTWQSRTSLPSPNIFFHL